MKKTLAVVALVVFTFVAGFTVAKSTSKPAPTPTPEAVKYSSGTLFLTLSKSECKTTGPVLVNYWEAFGDVDGEDADGGRAAYTSNALVTRNWVAGCEQYDSKTATELVALLDSNDFTGEN